MTVGEDFDFNAAVGVSLGLTGGRNPVDPSILPAGPEEGMNMGSNDEVWRIEGMAIG